MRNTRDVFLEHIGNASDFRRAYLNQIVVQIHETLKLHFFALEKLMGLEVDFDALLKSLKNAVVEDSDAETVLALSTVLVEHEIFEIRSFCNETKERWHPLQEPLLCFIHRVKLPRCYVNEAVATLHLNDIAEWINRKLYLQV